MTNDNHGQQGGREEQTERRMWKALEPYHGMIYFSPEARATFTDIGLKGYWMGYFASRAAALGPVSAQLVAAAFYNFHPRMVARAIPDAWKFAAPERILAARYAAADAALRRLLGERITAAEVAEAAALARIAAEQCDVAGRPMFAAHSALAWPDAPHLVLWHAATLLREYRFDGHVAALMAEGVDGCEAHVTLVGTGAMPRDAVQPQRGWSDDEWTAAEQRLAQRGWLDLSSTPPRLTDAGRQGRLAVEAHTDRLAATPWRALGSERSERLHALAWPLSDAIVRQGGVPMPNPMGINWP